MESFFIRNFIKLLNIYLLKAFSLFLSLALCAVLSLYLLNVEYIYTFDSKVIFALVFLFRYLHISHPAVDTTLLKP